MLICANGAAFSFKNRPTDWPRPRPAATPSMMARFSCVPVSSAIPKVPGPRVASTSSDVAPDSAISKSWMMPAPLVAIADTNPRSIRSTSTGDSPVFRTCAPKSPDDGAPVAAAPPARPRTTALKSPAASNAGKRLQQAVDAGCPSCRAWQTAPASPCSRASEADTSSLPTGRILRMAVSSMVPGVPDSASQGTCSRAYLRESRSTSIASP